MNKMIKKKMINWFLKPVDDDQILFDHLLNSFNKIYFNKNVNHLIKDKKKMFTQYCNWIYLNSHTTIEY